MRYFQKLLCLLILVLAASFGVGGCVLLYSDFSVQSSRMAAANAAAHAQACTLLQTEILDLQRRGISTGDAALTARVTAQDVPAALWRGDTLVCATLEGLQSLPLGDAATVTVRTENSIYAVYASDLRRTQITARAAARPRGLEVHIEPGLREIGMGVYEDRTFGDLHFHFPVEQKRFVTCSPDWAPEGGETFTQVGARVTDAVFRIARAHPDQTVAVFTHGTATRCLQSALRNKHPSQTP